MPVRSPDTRSGNCVHCHVPDAHDVPVRRERQTLCDIDRRLMERKRVLSSMSVFLNVFRGDAYLRGDGWRGGWLTCVLLLFVDAFETRGG